MTHETREAQDMITWQGTRKHNSENYKIKDMRLQQTRNQP